MIDQKTQQDSVVTDKVKPFLSESVKNRFQNICYSNDPVQTYINLIQCTTQTHGKLYQHGEYMQIYKECSFDLIHQCSLEDLNGVFKQIYTGFGNKYDRLKAKRTHQKKGTIIYGFHAMEKCCSDNLKEADYYFAQKKQKVRVEEYMYIAYLITHRYLQNGGAVILATNFFLCDYHQKNYKRETGRKLNKHKLFFMVDKLFKAEIIAKRKIGTDVDKHQRVLYTLDVNNPYYKATEIDLPESE